MRWWFAVGPARLYVRGDRDGGAVPWLYLRSLFAMGIGSGALGWLIGILFEATDRFTFGGGVEVGLAANAIWAINACICLAVMWVCRVDITKTAGLGEEH